MEEGVEELGAGRPGERAVRGSRWVAYFWRKCHSLCIKAGLKKGHVSLITHSFQKWSEGGGGGGPGREVGGCLPRGSCMVRIFWNVSQRWSFKKRFRMHCYAFVMLYLKDGPLRRSSECILCFRNVVSQRLSLKEFGMHCYAFVMLYLKDGPLRRSSECIAMLS